MGTLFDSTGIILQPILQPFIYGRVFLWLPGLVRSVKVEIFSKNGKLARVNIGHISEIFGTLLHFIVFFFFFLSKFEFWEEDLSYYSFCILAHKILLGMFSIKFRDGSVCQIPIFCKTMEKSNFLWMRSTFWAALLWHYINTSISQNDKDHRIQMNKLENITVLQFQNNFHE